MGSAAAVYIPRKAVRNVLPDSTAAGAVWQILINSITLSTILMR